MNSSKLAAIQPKYPHLVKYTKRGDPLLDLPDVQHGNESIFPADEPLRPIDLEKNTKWAQDLRSAARSK